MKYFVSISKLHLGSYLLASIALMPVISALLMMFSGNSEFYYDELVGLDFKQVSPQLKKSVDLSVQVRGLYLLALALFWLIVSLIPFRNGEKWAWYALFAIGAFWISGYIYYVSIGIADGVYLSTWLYFGFVWIVLWLLGLVLTIKEFFRKTETRPN